ncbi:hypothetical protein [Paraburkholderia youngii]|uniref:hypothetical protein n=1 Tax=Paraburkholderia youngii TaxID=2782701 RepID=UPI001591F817|nr:hypothetical protein [Paraburkholderia youngii]NUX55959.1 hypothetical protein [Paraburkholderia youngii]
MSSFHRGDWLSAAQTVASIVAIAGAYGVVFVQDCLERKRAERTEARQLLRDRYQAATYVHAIIGNAVDVAKETVDGVAELASRHTIFEQLALETARLDVSADALAQALHRPLPSELIECVHSAWQASQLLARAAHRAHGQMNCTTMLEYCRVQHAALQGALRNAIASREKWRNDLSSEGSVVDRLREAREM